MRLPQISSFEFVRSDYLQRGQDQLMREQQPKKCQAFLDPCPRLCGKPNIGAPQRCTRAEVRAARKFLELFGASKRGVLSLFVWCNDICQGAPKEGVAGYV